MQYLYKGDCGENGVLRNLLLIYASYATFLCYMQLDDVARALRYR